MGFHRRPFLAAFAILVSSTLAIPFGSALPPGAPLPIQVTASAWQAAAGNSNDAYILMYLANPDGTPKVNVQIPLPDPNGGLQLKGSNWSFRTMIVPPTFEGKGIEVLQPATLFNPAQSRLVELEGQLRVMQITPQISSPFRKNNPRDPQAGLYALRILPTYGFPGGKKALLKWVAGEYHYRISYREGNNQGTALGVLIVR